MFGCYPWKPWPFLNRNSGGVDMAGGDRGEVGEGTGKRRGQGNYTWDVKKIIVQKSLKTTQNPSSLSRLLS